MWLLIACTTSTSAEVPADVKPLTPPHASGDPRAHVAQAFGLHMVTAELTDVWPDRPYHVALWDDSADGTPDRATLDADRDGQVDQHWTREGDALMVSTNGGAPEAWTGPVPSGLELGGSR